MKLHRFDSVRNLKADLTYRTPPWTMLVFPIVLIAICGAMAWAIWNRHLTSIFWVSVAIMAPFIPAMIKTSFLPTFRPSNWVVKVVGNSFYIMLRNYRAKHFADDGPVVAEFLREEIAAVGSHVRVVETVSSSNKKTTWNEYRLEISLRNGVPNEFKEALAAERNRQPPQTGIVRSISYPPSPVTIHGEVIRILWRGKSFVVKPAVEKVVEELSRIVSTQAATREERRDTDDIDADELEKRVRELLEAGERMHAAKLLVRHKGISLTDAVKELNLFGR